MSTAPLPLSPHLLARAHDRAEKKRQPKAEVSTVPMTPFEKVIAATAKTYGITYDEALAREAERMRRTASNATPPPRASAAPAPTVHVSRSSLARAIATATGCTMRDAQLKAEAIASRQRTVAAAPAAPPPPPGGRKPVRITLSDLARQISAQQGIPLARAQIIAERVLARMDARRHAGQG